LTSYQALTQQNIKITSRNVCQVSHLTRYAAFKFVSSDTLNIR
jgi:hypothetical protein